MKRALLLVAIFLSLASPAALAINECAGPACVAKEESRTGGHCDGRDAESAQLRKYYNATVDVGVASIDERTEASCVDEQISHSPSTPPQDNMHSAFFSNLTITIAGRYVDEHTTLEYGTYGGCRVRLIAGAYVGMIPMVGNVPYISRGPDEHDVCDFSGGIPPLAESLP